MRAAARAARDARVVAMWRLGGSYRDIAGAVGLKSPTSVGNIVRRHRRGPEELDLLRERADDITLERLEMLWGVAYASALRGDATAAGVALRILDLFARVTDVHGRGRSSSR